MGGRSWHGHQVVKLGWVVRGEAGPEQFRAALRPRGPGPGLVARVHGIRGHGNAMGVSVNAQARTGLSPKDKIRAFASQGCGFRKN